MTDMEALIDEAGLGEEGDALQDAASRKERNRIAAQKSRDKKRRYVNTLEDLVKRLEDENRELRAALDRLVSDNSRLRRRLEVHPHDASPVADTQWSGPGYDSSSLWGQ
jgi:predicted RNase H-like nuclease (RuvC/YqgF family)